MTDDELAELNEYDSQHPKPPYWTKWHVSSLLAELRQLRADNATLKQANTSLHNQLTSEFRERERDEGRGTTMKIYRYENGQLGMHEERDYLHWTEVPELSALLAGKRCAVQRVRRFKQRNGSIIEYVNDGTCWRRASEGIEDDDSLARTAAVYHWTELPAASEPREPKNIGEAWEQLQAENAELRAKLAAAERERDARRLVPDGITLLDAKWLDPECHDGCKSLILKQRAERAESACTAYRNAGLQLRRVSLPPNDMSGRRMWDEAEGVLMNSSAGQPLLDELAARKKHEAAMEAAKGDA